MTLSRRPTIEGVFYPVGDDMGEHELQTLMRELLRPLLARFLASREVVAHAGSEQFIYWEKGNPEACVCPDAYVLPGVPQSRVISNWKTWEEGGIVPSFALEIVTREVAKDYEDAPDRYRALGVREVVIYDPRLSGAPQRIQRHRFQVFRRTSAGFTRVLTTEDDRVRSTALGAWIRVVGEGPERRLRVATGLRGEALVPTNEERADAADQRADAERERADAERERADAERERAERLEAALRALEAKSKRTRRS